MRKHLPRVGVTLLPVLLALMHATGAWPLNFIDRLDHFIYDTRLRATMPRTIDPRIVIVDIDDSSLHRLGQWPWSRDKLARLVDELIRRQQVAALGFDVLFVEPDTSSGLDVLRRLAQGPLRGDTDFNTQLERIAPELDHDAVFAAALAGQPVALGYYFTRSATPSASGRLPEPVLPLPALPSGSMHAAPWNGFGGNIAPLAGAAATAGFLNVLLDADRDGVVRSVPLLALYDGTAARPGYYEALSLAVHRIASADPPASIAAAMAPGVVPNGTPKLQALIVGSGADRRSVPVDESANALVPFRGPGGAKGGSFRYVSAADVLAGKLAPAELRGKIVLVGATAPGLQDLRPTPVDIAFPGVEVHANVISGLLDRRLPSIPDYAKGFEVAMLLVVGLLLAWGFSVLPVLRATLLAAATAALLVGLDAYLYLQHALVLPLAASLTMVVVAFAINMSWGYLVESRASRGLADLFGTYVPPELVAEMRADPRRYSMRAESRELTVMFCDMRGFTRLSEHMAPDQLQVLLNQVFTRLTHIIRRHRGTVDKYMGDCVMAFWGAPVAIPDHAALAVQAALDMAEAVREFNRAAASDGRTAISVGIGLNTGVMSVGDMGSDIRRSYTVVGDAVNLAARLEGLGEFYGVEIVASASTQLAAPAWLWQELDLVRVKGKDEVVRIFSPVAPLATAHPDRRQEIAQWHQVLSAYRAQDWPLAEKSLSPLLRAHAKKYLYQLCAQRLASVASLPKRQDWDGATRFDSK